MTKIDAHGLGYRELNEELRRAEGEIEIDGCMGQRFIASGMSGKKIKINGIPGNALGAYLDGSEIEVMGNVQDAVGDTMNFGTIAVHGSAGDAVGYAMRGGEIRSEERRVGISVRRIPRRDTHEGIRRPLPGYRDRRKMRLVPRRISGGRTYNRPRKRR